ncbi:MAG: hypothetical protein ACBR15_19350 [Microcoleus sp.]
MYKIQKFISNLYEINFIAACDKINSISDRANFATETELTTHGTSDRLLLLD